MNLAGDTVVAERALVTSDGETVTVTIYEPQWTGAEYECRFQISGCVVPISDVEKSTEDSVSPLQLVLFDMHLFLNEVGVPLRFPHGLLAKCVSRGRPLKGNRLNDIGIERALGGEAKRRICIENLLSEFAASLVCSHLALQLGRTKCRRRRLAPDLAELSAPCPAPNDLSRRQVSAMLKDFL